MNIRSYFNAPNISLIFIGLMVTLPFLFPHRSLPIYTFYLEWLTALFAFLAFIPLIKQTAWPNYQAPAIVLLPISILGLMVLQYTILNIDYWQQYFLVAQYFIFAGLLMVLGYMLKESMGFDKTMYIIAIFLVVSGILSTIVIVLDLANIHLGGWIVNQKSGGAVANVGQQNHLATLLALALASLSYLFVKQRVTAWQVWPLLIILLAALALTTSRSAWVFVVLISISALTYRHLQGKYKQVLTHQYQNNSTLSAKRLISILALPILFYLVQLGLPHIPTTKQISTTNQRLVQLAEKKGSVRLNMYKSSWYIYTDNPLIGVGFGQMAWHDLNNASRVPDLKGATGQAHNTIMQFLAETGTVGTTILLVFLFAFVLRLRLASVSPERWLWWLLLCIIGTHAMLEYPLWYMHYLALTSLLLGVGDLKTYNLSRYRPQLLLTVFAMFWASSLVQTMHDYPILERWFHKSLKVKFTNDSFDKMFKELQPIRTLSPFAVYADNQLLSAMPTNRDSLKEKLDITSRLLKTYNSPALAYNYATLLALDGKIDAAKAHLNNTYLRHPSSIDTYWQRTVRLTLNGEPQLFPFVKHIESLRDGSDVINDEAPNIDNFQFKQPSLSPNSHLDTSARG